GWVRRAVDSPVECRNEIRILEERSGGAFRIGDGSEWRPKRGEICTPCFRSLPIVPTVFFGTATFVYAEPLNGIVAPEQISPAITSLCRKCPDGRRMATLAGLRRSGSGYVFTTRTRPSN